MKFDQYLGGMVELRLPEHRTEEILQEITGAGIHLYQVKRQKDGLYLWILLDDFAVLQHLLRERRCPFHVQKRQGIPFFISKIKRQKGLWIGCFLCFSFVYLLFSFLWSYEVSGNISYSDEHIIALVQEYGLLPGSRSDKFDYDALQHKIVLDHPEFTWIQLRPNGTTLHISVKERLPEGQVQHQQGSIVAGADGRITELLVFRGTPMVKRGDWVKKGQVLIGGWDYPDRERDINGEFGPIGEPYAVKARGVIYGEQERVAVGSCALEERTLQSTGNRQEQIALVWNKHQAVIHGPKETPYQYSYQSSEIHSLLQWQQFSFPVYIKTTTFEEKKAEQRTYTQEEAYMMAVERARKRLQGQMPSGSRFIRESTGVYRPEQQAVVQAKVVWTIEDNLAEVQQMTLPQQSENNKQEQTAQATERQ